MKNNLILILLIFVPMTSFAQSDTVFIDSTRMQAQELFSQSERIELVKLKPYCSIQKRPIGIFGRNKEVEVCYASSVIHCIGDSSGYSCEIDTSHIGTKVPLAKVKFDTLFTILYSTEQINWGASCYNPRHGIAFYSKQNEMLGFLEICFECYAIHPLLTTPFVGTPNEFGLLRLKVMFEDEGLLDSER